MTKRRRGKPSAAWMSDQAIDGTVITILVFTGHRVLAALRRWNKKTGVPNVTASLPKDCASHERLFDGITPGRASKSGANGSGRDLAHWGTGIDGYRGIS
ncbi:hypothetical protein CO657_11210 [Rhizobium acidisoli]|uniref:Uncharacterized protein n=1 Tax=Rhizobium acidisoli TaxID=1538158 RepID=A0AAE5TX14_9HYPH|nr:hypothetical protein [Rhizobium acidisoli]QAS78601.1 hypothetical protein CO657_11210 [Rhizobium acidisoli]